MSLIFLSSGSRANADPLSQGPSAAVALPFANHKGLGIAAPVNAVGTKALDRHDDYPCVRVDFLPQHVGVVQDEFMRDTWCMNLS